MPKWIRWVVLMGWTACGAAHAEDSARVIRSVSLPSFGFGTVSQTAEVHGALAGRYETVPAQQDRESFVDVTEGHFQVPGGLPPSMIPDPFVPSLLDAVVVDWLTQHKNDPDGIMVRAFNATYQGKWHEARAMLDPIRDADPVSSYNLAQRRLEKLNSSHK